MTATSQIACGSFAGIGVELLCIVRELREAFPFDTAPKYLIFDRDTTFSAKVVRFVEAMGIKPCRTAYRSPWQNGVAERWSAEPCKADAAMWVIEQKVLAEPFPGTVIQWVTLLDAFAMSVMYACNQHLCLVP